MEAGNSEDWEVVGELGGGGQSDVFLVRDQARTAERIKCLQTIQEAEAVNAVKIAEVASAIYGYAQPDDPSWLGAKKVFKIRGDEKQAINRLRQEIQVLSQNRAGLPKLLGFNEKERWIVTEYFPNKTLEHQPSKYRGKVELALRAFLSLVETVAALHRENIIHRDIKPSNVFIRNDYELVLGDFGIVLLPDQPRHTRTNESVGPHAYLPPWADVGGRLEHVEPNFDVYMLGKLLWCMVSGRQYLSRESFDEPEYDLTNIFKGDPHMFIVNDTLAKCLVSKPKNCISTSDLLLVTRTYVNVVRRGGQLLRDGVPRPCHICGNGHYQSENIFPNQPFGGLSVWNQKGNEQRHLRVRQFICDTCGHIQFFRGET